VQVKSIFIALNAVDINAVHHMMKNHGFQKFDL
jgi:hypothetical protein